MSMLNIPLFDALGAKMSYLDRKNTVIAENIANADMPGYRAKELSTVDFGRVLDKVIQQDGVKVAPVSMMTTNPKHLPLPGVNQDAKTVQSRMTYEVAPNNNAVIIEEQMVKANETQMDYNLMTNLMRKNISMYYTALGRNN